VIFPALQQLLRQNAAWRAIYFWYKITVFFFVASTAENIDANSK